MRIHQLLYMKKGIINVNEWASGRQVINLSDLSPAHGTEPWGKWTVMYLENKWTKKEWTLLEVKDLYLK